MGESEKPTDPPWTEASFPDLPRPSAAFTVGTAAPKLDSGQRDEAEQPPRATGDLDLDLVRPAAARSWGVGIAVLAFVAALIAAALLLRSKGAPTEAASNATERALADGGAGRALPPSKRAAPAPLPPAPPVAPLLAPAQAAPQLKLATQPKPVAPKKPLPATAPSAPKRAVKSAKPASQAAAAKSSAPKSSDDLRRALERARRLGAETDE